MPSNRKFRMKTRRDEPELTQYLLYCFDVDSDPLGKFGADLTEAQVAVKLAELWKIHGKATVKHFIESEGPGYRPATFWRCELPGLRPQITWRGGSPGGDEYAADRALVRAQEVDVLYRHGMLTKEEKRSLAETSAVDFGYVNAPNRKEK